MIQRIKATQRKEKNNKKHQPENDTRAKVEELVLHQIDGVINIEVLLFQKGHLKTEKHLNKKEKKALNDGMNVEEIKYLILGKIHDLMIVKEIDGEEDQMKLEDNKEVVIAILQEINMEANKEVIILLIAIATQVMSEKKVVKVDLINRIHIDLQMVIHLRSKKVHKDSIREKETVANNLDSQRILEEMQLQVEFLAHLIITGNQDIIYKDLLQVVIIRHRDQ